MVLINLHPTDTMKENRSIKKYIPYIVLALAALSLLYRAHLSFCWSDECFYFSTTNRFLSGDLMVRDEWFPTQFVSIILMPLQALYRGIAGSYDGVILYFRVLYVLFSFATSCYIFAVLSKRNGRFSLWSALGCALWYLFYVHLNIATLSYYTLSMGFFLIFLLLVYDSLRETKDLKLVLSGLFLALAVLSLPTLAAAYFILVAAALLVSLIIKSGAKKLRRSILMNFLGILIPAVPVTAYLLLTSGISGIMEGMVYVLSDEEHRTSLTGPFKNFFTSVYDVYSKPLVFICLGLFAAGLISHVINSKAKIYIKAVIFISSLAAFGFGIYKAGLHTGFSAAALLFAALPIFAITDMKKRDLGMFLTLFAGGLVFSMVYSYSSMCDLYVLSIGHNISALAGICFISDHAGEATSSAGKLTVIRAGACGLIVIMCISLNACLRFENIYRDDMPEKLTAKVTSGVAKGLYTSPEHLKVYESLLSDIRSLTGPDSKVFFTKLLPWGYLSCDSVCGAPTTWRTEVSSDRLRLYYERFPERVPDVVFVMDDEVGSYESCGDVEADPCPNTNHIEGFLKNLMDREGYSKLERECCTVYIKQ